MLFSKSFGYALRGVLYIALVQDQTKRVQVEEIAARLNVPRHFMSKILKDLVKKQLLVSVKGPHGGYSMAEHTLKMPLYQFIEMTDGLSTFNTCVLYLRKCSSSTPCAMHSKVTEVKDRLKEVFATNTIGDLLSGDKSKIINSIAAGEVEQLIY